ncbi:unnamed protein product [Didymodactylos carnosus]|uniref:Uncharacterized protein n=1 Tax=Didymodactylos carnosus TaxID=1234261 RepID=A0A814MT49_9BILA|nr:unnamed protein product [Didymodactylos carnosus]CAF3848581.1 unnamed protein product [Didymodactylos carnosus]
MSNNSENFLADLEALLSVNETERYEKFLAVIDKYGYLHKHSIQSVNEFDKIHNDLLDLLFDADSGPSLGLSKFDKFQSIMTDLRRLIETLVIQHRIQVEKLNITGITMKRLEDDEMKDLKDLLYETEEFQKLAFAISTPLKNTLSRRFRTEEIRMDPLDEDVIDALLTDTRPFGISKEKFDSIRCIYEADTIEIEYKQIIEIIHCRQQRNVEQHELLDQYVRRCKKSGMKSKFSDLLEHLHLRGLYKYKTPKMKILGKIFDFYVTHDEYR